MLKQILPYSVLVFILTTSFEFTGMNRWLAAGLGIVISTVLYVWIRVTATTE